MLASISSIATWTFLRVIVLTTTTTDKTKKRFSRFHFDFAKKRPTPNGKRPPTNFVLKINWLRDKENENSELYFLIQFWLFLFASKYSVPKLLRFVNPFCNSSSKVNTKCVFELYSHGWSQQQNRLLKIRKVYYNFPQFNIRFGARGRD